MDIPVGTFIAYSIIWGLWVLVGGGMVRYNEINYAIKLDDITYNNVSKTEFPFGPVQFSDFNMV